MAFMAAFLTAWIHGEFFILELRFLLTILPRLFLYKSLAVKRPTVIALLPRSTMTLAIRPFAILLTDFFFMAFIAFMAFMAAFFFITFMAFMAFMAAFLFITFIAAFMAFMAAFFFITFGAAAFIAFIALAIMTEKLAV